MAHKTKGEQIYPRRLDIRMTEQQKKWLDVTADKQGVTASQLLRNLIDAKRGR